MLQPFAHAMPWTRQGDVSSMINCAVMKLTGDTVSCGSWTGSWYGSSGAVIYRHTCPRWASPVFRPDCPVKAGSVLCLLAPSLRATGFRLWYWCRRASLRRCADRVFDRQAVQRQLLAVAADSAGLRGFRFNGLTPHRCKSLDGFGSPTRQFRAETAV